MVGEGPSYLNAEPNSGNPAKLLGAFITAQANAAMGVLDGIFRTVDSRPIVPSIEWMNAGPAQHVGHQALESQVQIDTQI